MDGLIEFALELLLAFAETLAAKLCKGKNPTRALRIAITVVLFALFFAAFFALCYLVLLLLRAIRS